MARVELIGPPSVAITIVSKIWNEPIKETTITMMRTGRSKGIVMRVNSFHSDAPSSDPAS